MTVFKHRIRLKAELMMILVMSFQLDINRININLRRYILSHPRRTVFIVTLIHINKHQVEHLRPRYYCYRTSIIEG